MTLTRFDLWQAQANLHDGLDHMKLLESLVISAYCPEQRPQKHEPQQAQTSLIQVGFPVLTFAPLPTDGPVNHMGPAWHRVKGSAFEPYEAVYRPLEEPSLHVETPTVRSIMGD